MNALDYVNKIFSVVCKHYRYKFIAGSYQN